MVDKVATRLYGVTKEDFYGLGNTQKEKFTDLALQLLTSVKYDERNKPQPCPLPEVKLSIDLIP